LLGIDYFTELLCKLFNTYRDLSSDNALDNFLEKLLELFYYIGSGSRFLQFSDGLNLDKSEGKPIFSLTDKMDNSYNSNLNTNSTGTTYPLVSTNYEIPTSDYGSDNSSERTISPSPTTVMNTARVRNTLNDPVNRIFNPDNFPRAYTGLILPLVGEQ
jgi:hypothetical protein